jgi:hypothetical protein
MALLSVDIGASNTSVSRPAPARRPDDRRHRQGREPPRELLVNADPADDRAFHVQVAFWRFLEAVIKTSHHDGSKPPRPNPSAFT